MALWILISGADDLFIDLVCLFTWLSGKTLSSTSDDRAEREAARATNQKRIAILVPLWREDTVIEPMITNNIARIEYLAYDFFLGAYPNDEATLTKVRELSARFPNVHFSVCGNPGPTSKADCLNCIYQRMLAHEHNNLVRYEVIVTHDAEDVIHPEALHFINYHADVYDMIQIPILPLPTPIGKWTHGVYCDEFAEFQIKDMPGRQILGGFIPSNGVGTGFTRWGLDQLAKNGGRIFEPESLTEDYENGLRLHFLGCPQLFMPVRFHDGRPVATREYFPDTRRAAIRQRTRWVTGIALQSWQRHGWRGGLGTKYWMWRDRKGLIGNPVSMFTSILSALGATTWCLSELTGTQSVLDCLWRHTSLLWVMGSTTTLQLVHLGVRAWCTSRIYGWAFAAGVPVRAVYANYINFRATLGAVWRYARSRVLAEPLVWLKTDHNYPAVETPPPRLDRALDTEPDHVTLRDHLVETELSRQNAQEDISLSRLSPRQVPREVARSFPAPLVRDWRVLPFRVSGGFLFVAADAVPDRKLYQELSSLTRLQIRVQLVTPANFDELTAALL